MHWMYETKNKERENGQEMEMEKHKYRRREVEEGKCRKLNKELKRETDEARKWLDEQCIEMEELKRGRYGLQYEKRKQMYEEKRIGWRMQEIEEMDKT